MKKHRIRTIILWPLFALALGLAIYWAMRPKAIPVEAATVARGPYEQQVIEEGKTRARDIYKILSPVDGELHRVPHKAGDKVQADALLAEVDRPGIWRIRSPIQGTVLRVQRESGGPIRRGELIMEVADPRKLEVVSEVLTEDALGLRPGFPVRMESWGECPALRGKVRLVEPGAFTKVSALGIEEQRVNVVIDFEDPTLLCEGLADGFRLYNYMTTFHAEDVLTIPAGALFRDGREWAVFKIVDGRARKSHVQIARRNPEMAMLAGGLEEGDWVVVYPSDEITDGARVEVMEKMAAGI